jgi:hypothetical protein
MRKQKLWFTLAYLPLGQDYPTLRLFVKLTSHINFWCAIDELMH